MLERMLIKIIYNDVLIWYDFISNIQAFNYKIKN